MVSDSSFFELSYPNILKIPQKLEILLRKVHCLCSFERMQIRRISREEKVHPLMRPMRKMVYEFMK